MIEVHGNDWSSLVPHVGARWTPTNRVTVCIPAHDPTRLDRTLLGLALQTYPTSLIDVVVADDGSESPIVVEGTWPFPVRVVHLEPKPGFGAGRARNAAATAAEGEVLVFLDADIVPERQAIASYLRWFRDRPDVFVMGLCRFADTNELDDVTFGDLVASNGLAQHFTGREVDGQQWRENTFRRTEDLRKEADDAFRVVIGATFAVRADHYRAVGGFRELGIRGIEDTEFGYRMHADGAPMVLDRDAVHWHQGPRTMSLGRKAQIQKERQPYLERLLPVRGFRTASSDPPDQSVHTVPRVVVHGAADAYSGVKCWDVRVVPHGGAVTSPDGMPFVAAYCHIWVPDGVSLADVSIRAILDTFAKRQVGAIVVPGPMGKRVVAMRTRALRRAMHELGLGPDVSPSSVVMDHVAESFGAWFLGSAAEVNWSESTPAGRPTT